MRRRLVLLAGVLIVAAGCGGGSHRSSAPTATRSCNEAGERTHAIRFRTSDGVRLAGAAVGSGPVGAVLIHEYPLDHCGWWPYARYLSRHGVRVLLFDLRCFGQSACPAGRGHATGDVAAAMTELRRRGARRVALVGASMPTSGFYKPAAARLGRGRTGVVFANDSKNDTCAWSREARSLAARGYAVAAFRTAGNYGNEASQVLAVARALRRTGVRRVVLVGASVGARALLLAAAQHPPGLAGVVALSAERRVLPADSDLLPVGRQVRVPVLSIGSRQDPFTSSGKDTAAWHRAIRDDRRLMVGGDRHGIELLGGRVDAAILRFLRSL